MDAILKSLSLGFLLRSVFAGTFFVFAYGMDTTGTSNGVEINSDNIFSVGLVFALVVGVTVYGIHRSVFFPWVEWLLNADWAKKSRREGRTLISKNTIDDVVRRWDSRARSGEEGRYRAEQIASWGDYIHLQYASAWCIVLGSVAGIIFGGRRPPQHWFFLSLLALFFVVAASISAWRSRSLEEHWSPVGPTKQPSESSIRITSDPSQPPTNSPAASPLASESPTSPAPPCYESPASASD